MITGKSVVISLTDGKRVKGSAISVGSDSLVMETDQGRRSVPRSSIREIRVPRKAGYKWRIIGMAVGAGIGSAVAVPVLTETHNEGSGRYDGAAVGLIGGLAALGYLAGWRTDKNGDVIHILPN